MKKFKYAMTLITFLLIAIVMVFGAYLALSKTYSISNEIKFPSFAEFNGACLFENNSTSSLELVRSSSSESSLKRNINTAEEHSWVVPQFLFSATQSKFMFLFEMKSESYENEEKMNFIMSGVSAGSEKSYTTKMYIVTTPQSADTTLFSSFDNYLSIAQRIEDKYTPLDITQYTFTFTSTYGTLYNTNKVEIQPQQNFWVLISYELAPKCKTFDIAQNIDMAFTFES